MFTGIVSQRGTVVSVGRRGRRRARGGPVRLEIECHAVARELSRGDSVSVNGVCLTATAVRRRRFGVEAMEETVARSTLGSLRRSEVVNLELPARLSDRLGGHLVQGHVDGVATALRIEDEDGARRVWWSAPDDLLRYMVAKGSVALDGVSLTLVEVGRTSFQVALIPPTLEGTSLGDVAPGARANLEVDVMAKYVERSVASLRAREPHREALR
jgi:riboflavin synthase